MKRKISVFLIVLICIALSALILAGCTPNLKGYVPSGENLAAGASYVYESGKTSKKMELSGTAPAFVTVRLDGEKTFNTIVLKSTENNVDGFEIAIGGETVYRQDEIGDVRSCWLGARTASEIRITVTKSDGKFNLNFFGLYNTQRGDRNFRVTTYLETGDDGERLAGLDGESLKNVDQVILFNATDYRFTKDSTVDVDEAAFARALDFVRAANPEIEVILNLLPKNENDLDWPYSVAKTHTDAFGGNPDQLIAQINALITKYDLAGIGFDYEYPQSKNDWKVFSQFLVRLKQGIGNKKISAAIQYNGGQLSAEAMNAVDQFEVMCYDFVGKNNSHSTFADAISMSLALLKSKNFDLNRINIGLPFYSRPQEQASKWELLHYWGDYKTYSDRLGKFENSIEVNETFESMYIKSLYFNSYQMIADKTAFLYDYGAGGVMIWNYASDVPYSDPLSLHRAVNDALNR